MVMPIDEPSDLLYGLIVHELTHQFEFDIIPQSLIRRNMPLWVNEGLSDYERGQWSPVDLMTVRDADDRSVLGRDQHDVELAILAVDGDRRDEIARGRRRDRQRFGERGLLLVRREVAAVVGRALLVAERLEALLQIALERLVELVLLQPQTF